MQLTTEHGTTVALHDLGGDGPTLLICHATGFCGRAYEPLAAVLGTRHHVWAVDLRGHGDSPPPPDGDFSWGRISVDVLAAVRAIASEPIHVVGHSMGGAVAMQAEADHPGLFASAYLYEPIIVQPGMRKLRTTNPLADGARKRREVFSSKEEVLWRFASRPPLDRLGAGSLAAYVEHGFEDMTDGTVRLKCRAEHEARTFEASGSITTQTVASVSIPVLVATGGEPDSPLAALAPGIVGALPEARHIVYEHLDHFGPFEDLYTITKDVFAHTAA
jgi:pimeloyl-ACP methyl ester carboxylesterase